MSPAANVGEWWGQFAAGLDLGPLTSMKTGYRRLHPLTIQAFPDIGEEMTLCRRPVAKEA